MSDIRVAQRYAKSLLELATSQGVQEAVLADVNLYLGTVAANPELALAMNSPVINHDKKLAVLRSLFGNKMNGLTIHLFEMVTRKHREAVLAQIARQYVVLYNQTQGIVEAMVSTAVFLDDSLRQRMIAQVAQISGSTKVVLEEKIDPALIGGYILRVGDRQIDESLSGKLSSLKRQLTDESFISKL